MVAGGCAIKAERVCWLYFRVYGLVHLLSRESFERGWGPWLSTRWVLGGEGGGATVTMTPFWNSPTRWHHGFGEWRLAFCLLTGTNLGCQLGGGANESTSQHANQPAPPPPPPLHIL